VSGKNIPPIPCTQEHRAWIPSQKKRKKGAAPGVFLVQSRRFWVVQKFLYLNFGVKYSNFDATYLSFGIIFLTFGAIFLYFGAKKMTKMFF